MAELLYQGHGSYRIVSNEGVVIYVDPYAGEGYDMPADIVIVTHEHSDHNQVDLVTLKDDGVILRHGDLFVDGHHSVEDIGIALGQAFTKAMGDKVGIKRYGTAFVPMDEALIMVSLDLSGRAFLNYEVLVKAQMIGDYDTELTEEFLRAFAFNAGITLHVKMMAGSNSHHIVEGVFKALARALREALTIDERIQGVMSTKGML